MRVVVLLALLVGCTQRTSIRHAGTEIGERGTVKLRTGEEREVSLVGYVPAGIVVDDGYSKWEVPYANLESLEYESHAGGAWQGLKWGGAIGAAFGAAWGLALSQSDDDIFEDPGPSAFAGAVIWGLVGVMFGTPIGAIKGKTTIYSME